MISRYLLAGLSLAGIALDLLGGLYLAYDLLGGRRGPLRTLARAATYAVVFGAPYTVGLPLAFGPVAGVGLGLLLGVEYGLQRGETAGLIFAVLRGSVFGLAGGLLHGERFGVVFGVATAFGLVGVYRLRFSVARDYPTRDAPRIRAEAVRAQAIRASVTAVAATLAGVVAGLGSVSTVLFAIRLGLVSWVTGGVVGSAAPLVERWADEVSTRRLGMIGAVLILTGLLLQSVAHWVVVLNVAVH